MPILLNLPKALRKLPPPSIFLLSPLYKRLRLYGSKIFSVLEICDSTVYIIPQKRPF